MFIILFIERETKEQTDQVTEEVMLYRTHLTTNGNHNFNGGSNRLHR